MSDILSDFNQIWFLTANCPVGAALIHTERGTAGRKEGRTYRQIERQIDTQTDRRAAGHDEGSSRFSVLCEYAKEY